MRLIRGGDVVVLVAAAALVGSAYGLFWTSRAPGERVTVTVGVGGRVGDYQAVGAPFAKRHQRMDEQVAEMRRIWQGEPPAPGLDEVGPRPVQQGVGVEVQPLQPVEVRSSSSVPKSSMASFTSSCSL